MSQPSARTKKQDRWYRNKLAQRERQRASRLPKQLSPEFLAKLDKERIQRGSREASKWGWEQPTLNFWTSSGGIHWLRKRDGRWLEFVADVWAAIVEIEAMRGKGKANPTTIVRHLTAQRRLHSYTEGSARIRIYRARETISAFERAACEDPDAEFWLPFQRDDGDPSD